MIDHDKAYAVARYEHAWRLREEGMIYRKIGDRLGVSLERARQMYYVFARRVRSEDRRRRYGSGWVGHD